MGLSGEIVIGTLILWRRLETGGWQRSATCTHALVTA
jgi:hypothetical protein